MEFYSVMKKNEILLFSSKWMELENIILSEVSQDRRSRIVCYFLYVDFRFRANPAMLFDLSHMLRGELIWMVWG
jgi:hypothetical protein